MRPDHGEQEVRGPVVEAADEVPSMPVHDVVKRVPRVVRSRNVVEEQEDTGEKLKRYQEERRSQGVDPGLSDRPVQKVPIIVTSRLVLQPVPRRTCGVCCLGSRPIAPMLLLHSLDYVRRLGTLFAPRTVLDVDVAVPHPRHV